MELFAEKLFNDSNLCKFSNWEDYGLASFRCLKSLSVFPEDTRDREGRQRFFPSGPWEELFNIKDSNYPYDPINGTTQDIFHENVIAFHHLTPNELLLAEAMYRIIPHDIRNI
ncbi:unnamed protein product [Enterobius vermicularis]|uniref:Protein kinase domain-containing protein n=1 Tax=Enterobius vermicularis TaxID=51028 RepID=A0A0N4UT01_ENTVE|nr:unnamed protein product [Enterobius vermicularis]